MVGSGEKQKIIVVCGPTATGKSGLALALSRRFGGEMVSADSMQIYRGLVIGTAALTPEKAAGVQQHLTGYLPPQLAFSVAEWMQVAAKAIDGIASRGHVPVVCGGTGLYIESMVKGIRFDAEKPDPARRRMLDMQWDEWGGEAMLHKLATVDPDRAAQLHPHDRKRVLRALEQAMATGLPAHEREARSRQQAPPYDVLCLGLDYTDRADLYAAIDTRVDAMMAEGLEAEARDVWKNRNSYKTAAQAIGYKELFPFFEGEAPLGDCVDKLKQATRNYAKRQLTWFRRMEGVEWLYANDPDTPRKAEELVGDFLELPERRRA